MGGCSRKAPVGASCEVHIYLHYLRERGSDKFVEHDVCQGLASPPDIKLMICG